MVYGVGSEIGGCRLLEKIGEGGMSQVYRAYQPSSERLVALKILPPMQPDAACLERFKREARIGAKLEHPHILPVYGYGEDQGATYLAMRYLRAETLTDVLARSGGRLSLTDVTPWIGQVASALDYAHAQGIIHRDVKPSNILIDAGGDAYLTDFGVARILGEADLLARPGGALGTPGYMSPEQAAGKSVDARSDVYNLGVVLYEMVTGRLPFEEDTPYAMMVAHIKEAPPPPAQVNPGLPPEVERVILKALQKQPRRRYASAGKMAQALAAAVEEAG